MDFIVLAGALLVCGLLIAGIALAGNQEKTSSSRYVLVKDGGRSSRSSVLDRQSKAFLQRQVQVRVSTLRPLPEPVTGPDYGDLLCSTKFGAGYCGSANLQPSKSIVRDGYRIWQFKDIFDGDDFAGKKAFGITVKWPQEGGVLRSEPLEIFAYPPPGDPEPGQWTGWQKASTRRAGEFGWWAEVHGNEPEATDEPPYPFEIRWRLLLTDEPLLITDDEEIH